MQLENYQEQKNLKNDCNSKYAFGGFIWDVYQGVQRRRCANIPS